MDETSLNIPDQRCMFLAAALVGWTGKVTLFYLTKVIQPHDLAHDKYNVRAIDGEFASCQWCHVTSAV